MIDGWGISCEIALIWMSLDLNDEKSTLVQVMAWCRQATSHYLSQCWPRSLSSYGVTRPQWVKQLETHGCVLSTVATDALALKHQAISTQSADSYLCISKWNNHWQVIITCPVPSGYLNQCWLNFSCKHTNKVQWNFIKRQKCFLQINTWCTFQWLSQGLR